MKMLNLRTLVLVGIVGVLIVGGVVPCMSVYPLGKNNDYLVPLAADTNTTIDGQKDSYTWTLYVAPNRYTPAKGNTPAHFAHPTNNGFYGSDDDKNATSFIFYRKKPLTLNTYEPLFYVTMVEKAAYSWGSKENLNAGDIYRSDRSDQKFCWEFYEGQNMVCQGKSQTSTK